jgi:UDP-N-acetylglucosamine--N-acetylmuramyl-(pentapeptide) pyrophosphoryl-undecaprenol N-acetylglucosamine transferase
VKVILAGGGTGGHLYPGIAVAERLRNLGIPVLFMVSDRGLEQKVLSKLGYQYIEQKVSAFNGVGVIDKVISLTRFGKAAVSAMKYIGRTDKILLLGGFAAAPVALAGVMKEMDLYIHEQNSVMGSVNRMMGVHARRIFLSYSETNKSPARGIVVGNPVRSDLMRGSVKEENGRQILILGGSGGSRIINKTAVAAADKLLKAGYTIHHQTGEKLLEETLNEYEKNVDTDCKELQIEAYITDMAQAYAAADLVIARAGSGAVFETMYAKRPALYIPFARSSSDHQFYNALSVQKSGYAEILQEKDLDTEKFIGKINEMFGKINGYKESLFGVEPKDSAALIIKGMGL